MYIIDRHEHGNGGVCGTTILDKLSLKKALLKTPFDYGVLRKEFGFWPVILPTKKGNDASYCWDEDNNCWHKISK